MGEGGDAPARQLASRLPSSGSSSLSAKPRTPRKRESAFRASSPDSHKMTGCPERFCVILWLSGEAESSVYHHGVHARKTALRWDIFRELRCSCVFSPGSAAHQAAQLRCGFWAGSAAALRCVVAVCFRRAAQRTSIRQSSCAAGFGRAAQLRCVASPPARAREPPSAREEYSTAKLDHRTLLCAPQTRLGRAPRTFGTGIWPHRPTGGITPYGHVELARDDVRKAVVVVS